MRTEEERMTSEKTRQRRSGDIPRRGLGRTGVEVTAIGLGGYHLGTIKGARQAERIVQEAVDAGITFLDNAWEYHDGRSEEIMGKALSGGRRQRVFLMSKVCTHGRDRATAMRQLEQSLRRLRTDHLDLWQIHEVVYDNDPDRHFAPGGAIEALEQAKRQGKVRFVGFTGHKDPSIHLKMLAHGFPFDTCQMPLNCFDATFRSFEARVLPELNRRGIAAIGMKTMGGEGQSVARRAVKAEEALRYAMSLPVAVTVAGIDSMKVLQQDLRIARSFVPMSPDEMEALRKRCADLAADGRFESYKTTAKHEGPVGRRQHGYPPPEEVSA
jgi:aryl-alcohol dehydrogenase-like predicted oxidoreductase